MVKEGKELNLFVEFQLNSGDFLKVLGELSAKAEKGRPVALQAKDLEGYVSTMELFWDITEKIFLKYEQRLHGLHLLTVNEHAKAALLQTELKSCYNEMYKVRDKIPETIALLMKKTILPGKEELEKDVQLKNKSNG